VITFGHKSKGLFRLSILVLAGSSVAQAATWVLPERGSWMGAEGLALGGALVAQSGRSDFIYANPAAPAFQEKYSLGLSYGTAGDLMRVQVIDTKSSKLGGGISFSQRNVEDLSRLEDPALGNFARLEHSAVLSIMTRVSETVAVGLSAQHRYIRPASGGLVPTSFWTGDVGVAVKLSPEWTLGLAGLDMIADDKGYTYRTLSAGVSGSVAAGLSVLGQLDFVRAPEGSLDTGFVRDDASAALALGVDYLVAPELKLRGSYRNLSAWEQSYVGLGLGYTKDALTLDYGMRFSTETSKSQYHALTLSVDI